MPSVRTVGLGWVLLVALPAAVRAQVVAAPTPASPPIPDRSRELVDVRCASELGLRQVTLFANGTVRVREGLGKDPHMTLGEIGPDEMAGYLRRLAAEDLSDVLDAHMDTAQGSWVEQCTLRLQLDGRAPREIRYARYDSLPLPLATVLRVVDEVAGKAIPLDRFPVQYRAQRGDVLRRGDGALFEIVAFSDDKQSVELQGVEQPLVLYVRIDSLRREFVEIVSRPSPISGQ